MLAGHLPTMHFAHELWAAMRVWEPKEDWHWPGEGFYRGRINGKPIVGYYAPLDSGDVSFAVRPIVRVPMRKAAA